MGLRDFDKAKCDVVHKYSSEEARSLRSYGELPSGTRINQAPIEMRLGALLEDAAASEQWDFDFEEVSYEP